MLRLGHVGRCCSHTSLSSEALSAGLVCFDVGNVAFPSGYTIGADGDTMHLYYGAADTSIAMATGSVREILHWLERCEGSADSANL